MTDSALPSEASNWLKRNQSESSQEKKKHLRQLRDFSLMTLEEHIRLLARSIISRPTCSSLIFHSTVVGKLFNACRYGNLSLKIQMLLVLTVLTESSHESWGAAAWPVVFLTLPTILTNWTVLFAAGTPETLRTHCQKWIMLNLSCETAYFEYSSPVQWVY